MEDRDIIDLYWAREESAVAETDKKYGKPCRNLAFRILSSGEDAEECVDDAYMAAWNSIPPKRPENLPAYLISITRNNCLMRLRGQGALKRGGREYTAALDELGELFPSGESVEGSYEAKELAGEIDRFIATLSRDDRLIFVSSYWLAAPVATIAAKLGCSRGRVKSSLFRSRKKLYEKLKTEGFV